MKHDRHRGRWAAAAAITGLALGALFLWRVLPSGGPVPEGVPTAPPAGEGWLNLLDAAHAGGWRNITDDATIFEIQDGTLHIFGKSFYPLRYVAWETERLADFELHLEYRVARRANSGVFLRAQPNDPVHRGFEVQVLDDFGSAPHKRGAGGIYDVVTPMFNLARPAGEWNSFDIRVAGPHVTVRHNGWLVVQADLSQMTEPLGKFEIPFAELPGEGLLMLQDHGGAVWYRNIFIRKLPGVASGSVFPPAAD
ncbi:MAG: DUF1080 domain-containing protein [Candidatus Hydrogenedentes bacterium]|nr:DUF1080 domain-containing protein [Candidatus Hydrogenedentota bacterium]